MADWTALEREYITTDISYRDLAKKYGLHKSTVANRGSLENWPDKREQHRDKIRTKTLAKDEQKKVDRATRIYGAADLLLGRLELILGDQEAELSTKECKAIADTLRGLAEIHGMKNQLDIDEQKARIEKLRRDAQKEQAQLSRTVTMIFNAGEDEWNE